MNDAMPEPMGLRIEARVHDGRRDLHALRGDVVGRQAPRRPLAVRVFALDGDKWKPRRDFVQYAKSPHFLHCGIGINEADVSYTLTTSDRHIVAITPTA